MADATFKIDVDISDIDVALEKAERLKVVLNEVATISAGVPMHVINIAGPVSAADLERLRAALKDPSPLDRIIAHGAQCYR